MNKIMFIRRGLIVFAICISLATIGMIPLLLANDGSAYWIADFNSQQVPFYIYCNNHIKNNAGFWSWKTDLGSDFITSYSFYTLGSPFFWLTLFFPAELIRYILFPLMILKMGIAGVTSYYYIVQHVSHKKSALIGALAYTFSGYTINTLFYNHFLDVMAFFPLLLLSLDTCVYKHKKGVFALTVAVCALTNYVFFVGEVIFLILYFACKIITKEYKITVKVFLQLGIESIIGFCLSLPLVLPSVLELMNSSRATARFSDLKSALLFSLQEYVLLFKAFLLPSDFQNLECLYGHRYTCTEIWLPFISITFVITYFISTRKKKDFLKLLILICLFISIIPVLNSSFMMFNCTYYTRWFYMLALIMAFASAKAIDQYDYKATRWGALITLILLLSHVLFIYIVHSSTEPIINNNYFYVLFTVAFSAPILILLQTKSKPPRTFFLIITMIYSAIALNISSEYSKSSEGENYYNNFINFDVDLPQNEFYRTEYHEYNMSLVSDYYDIWNWNSTVSNSIVDFYNGLGYSRHVASAPNYSLYGIRNLLSVKYSFNRPEYGNWKELSTENGIIYENVSYIPMGFTFEYCISEKTYQNLPIESRHLNLQKVLVMNESDIEIYKDCISEIKDVNSLDLLDYEQELLKRRENTCTNFKINNAGFYATIELDKDQIIFFSVPYSKGWKAEVNGQNTDIIKVDQGLIAIRGSTGINNISFKYKTYGFTCGCIISIVAVILFAFYLIIPKKPRKERYLNHE